MPSLQSSTVMATPADEVPQKDIANQDTEDLEDGEIEDDEDEDTQQQQQPSLEKEEDGETNDDDDGNIKNRGTSSEPTAPEEDEDNNSSFGGVGGGRSKRHHHPTGGGGYKKHHKDRKSSRRDRDRERRRAQRELDADEEKKRRLKEKLHALEMQMAADDEDMGIYASGGSPNHDYVDEEDDLEEEAFDSEDGGSSDGGDFRRKRRRNLSPSRESDRKRRRGDERHHRGGRRMQRSDEICKLFMQGKCPKSPEKCMFSHDAEPPKIMELCKFYLFERCAKKEKCLYLHKGFPCKYFHTGMRCLDTAETCKFSHEPLEDETRAILLKHLESAPKEILGDFPRMSREHAAQLVIRTEARNKGWNPEEVAAATAALQQQQGLPQHGGAPPSGPFARPPMGVRPPPPVTSGAPPQASQPPPQLEQQQSTTSIQEKLVNLSHSSGNEGGDQAGRPPQPHGGERRRRSRWEEGRPANANMTPITLPPPGQALIHPPPRFGSRPVLVSPHMVGSMPPRQPGQLGPPSLGHIPGQMGLLGMMPGAAGANFMPQQHPFHDPQLRPMGVRGQMMPPPIAMPPMPTQEQLHQQRELISDKDEAEEQPEQNTFAESSSGGPPPIPPAQMKLYERIKQKQHGPEEQPEAKEDAPPEEEDFGSKTPVSNWYSSDEDEDSSKQLEIAEDNDAAKEETKSETEGPQQNEGVKARRDPRMNRDPRASARDPRKKRPTTPPPAATSTATTGATPAPDDDSEKRLMDLDLGAVFGDLELPTFKDIKPKGGGGEDVETEENSMGLPFKPHLVSAVAKEIDASIYSHTPLEYRLHAVTVSGPDYRDVVKHIPAGQVLQDPRLRRHVNPGQAKAPVSRRDPRRRE